MGPFHHHGNEGALGIITPHYCNRRSNSHLQWKIQRKQKVVVAALDYCIIIRYHGKNSYDGGLDMKKFNCYHAASAASTLLAILVIASELNKPFKTLLASLFGHHWVAKAVLITLAFIIVGFTVHKQKLFGKTQEDLAWQTTLGSLAAIFLFYIILYFV